MGDEARRHCVDLRAAGHFELVHGVERLADRRPAGQQPVVAQDQRIVRAEILHDPLALIEIDRRPLIGVITDMAMEADAGLVEGQQPALHRRDRHPCARMRVQHAFHVGARLVDGAVDDVARFVDAVIGVGLVQDVAFEIDLHEARRGDLAIEEPVEIDE